MSRSLYQVYYKAPTRQLHVIPIDVSGSGPIRKTSIRRCRSHAKKSDSQAALSRMQFTFHSTRRIPRDASRLVQAISAWSAATRRAPNWRCRDVRVCAQAATYGHAWHEYSHPPSPPLGSVPTCDND